MKHGAHDFDVIVVGGGHAGCEAAAAAAPELGYPVALKIVSPRLPQKSSIGGVALDIVDKEALLRRGREMLGQVATVVVAVAG